MIDIKIDVLEKDELPGGWIYLVKVSDGDEHTSHEVELTKREYQELTEGNIPAETLVERCFEFLLQREPKEKILKEFNLTEIKLYFPEFDEVITQMISQ